MTANLLQRPLRLTLHASDALPDGMSWNIIEGYVIAKTWSKDGDGISRCILSPRDLISSERPAIRRPPPPGAALLNHGDGRKY